MLLNARMPQATIEAKLRGLNLPVADNYLFLEPWATPAANASDLLLGPWFWASNTNYLLLVTPSELLIWSLVARTVTGQPAHYARARLHNVALLPPVAGCNAHRWHLQFTYLGAEQHYGIPTRWHGRFAYLQTNFDTIAELLVPFH
ncbi:hypothetical protein [Lacticaseibacillus nasuensis]|uniref:Uncharacterized protein n=1 Tax=Lacticaseibacillus nasuensis JCM 17158 TaxID=1291734 RepID=A0A0R1JMX0_9LACO|nr:hypothetical protein [Lacticaseibacillus nasuensis]KRK72552.1 hypothetical protein FD02_GL001525 [Lacticaseibacillus nasuensis JCM 17158]